MSVADKLKSIKLIKQDIRLALEEIGIQLNETTKFNNYADLIRAIEFNADPLLGTRIFTGISEPLNPKNYDVWVKMDAPPEELRILVDDDGNYSRMPLIVDQQQNDDISVELLSRTQTSFTFSLFNKLSMSITVKTSINEQEFPLDPFEVAQITIENLSPGTLYDSPVFETWLSDILKSSLGYEDLVTEGMPDYPFILFRPAKSYNHTINIDAMDFSPNSVVTTFINVHKTALFWDGHKWRAPIIKVFRKNKWVDFSISKPQVKIASGQSLGMVVQDTYGNILYQDNLTESPFDNSEYDLYGFHSGNFQGDNLYYTISARRVSDGSYDNFLIKVNMRTLVAERKSNPVYIGNIYANAAGSTALFHYDEKDNCIWYQYSNRPNNVTTTTLRFEDLEGIYTISGNSNGSWAVINTTMVAKNSANNRLIISGANNTSNNISSRHYYYRKTSGGQWVPVNNISRGSDGGVGATPVFIPYTNQFAFIRPNDSVVELFDFPDSGNPTLIWSRTISNPRGIQYDPDTQLVHVIGTEHYRSYDLSGNSIDYLSSRTNVPTTYGGFRGTKNKTWIVLSNISEQHVFLELSLNGQDILRVIPIRADLVGGTSWLHYLDFALYPYDDISTFEKYHIDDSDSTTEILAPLIQEAEVDNVANTIHLNLFNKSPWFSLAAQEETTGQESSLIPLQDSGELTLTDFPITPGTQLMLRGKQEGIVGDYEVRGVFHSAETTFPDNFYLVKTVRDLYIIATNYYIQGDTEHEQTISIGRITVRDDGTLLLNNEPFDLFRQETIGPAFNLDILKDLTINIQEVRENILHYYTNIVKLADLTPTLVSKCIPEQDVTTGVMLQEGYETQYSRLEHAQLRFKNIAPITSTTTLDELATVEIDVTDVTQVIVRGRAYATEYTTRLRVRVQYDNSTTTINYPDENWRNFSSIFNTSSDTGLKTLKIGVLVYADGSGMDYEFIVDEIILNYNPTGGGGGSTRPLPFQLEEYGGE